MFSSQLLKSDEDLPVLLPDQKPETNSLLMTKEQQSLRMSCLKSSSKLSSIAHTPPELDCIYTGVKGAKTFQGPPRVSQVRKSKERQSQQQQQPIQSKKQIIVVKKDESSKNIAKGTIRLDEDLDDECRDVATSPLPLDESFTLYYGQHSMTSPKEVIYQNIAQKQFESLSNP